MAIRVQEIHYFVSRAAPSDKAADGMREFYAGVLDMGAGAEPTTPHVAYAVADIAETRLELDRLGIRYEALESSGNPRVEQLLLRDPAGNLLEIHQVGSCRCTAASRTAAPESYTRVRSAVMFADMRGFTSISEQLAPAQVVPLLNEYFAMLTDTTLSHGGTVLNMAGDGLMVCFGVPLEQADAPSRAVDTAREMLGRFATMAQDWKLRHGIDTGLGIGINVGEVIAGHVGSDNYRSYTIIGDTVNVAARLSQRARAGEALFSGAVKRSLEETGHDLPARELPALQLRGRASPVEIFCLPAVDRLDFRPAATSAR